MEQIATVFVIVAHFTVMGYGGDALPEGKRAAYASLKDCKDALPAVSRSFERSALPVKPDRVTCEKLEIKR